MIEFGLIFSVCILHDLKFHHSIIISNQVKYSTWFDIIWPHKMHFLLGLNPYILCSCTQSYHLRHINTITLQNPIVTASDWSISLLPVLNPTSSPTWLSFPNAQTLIIPSLHWLVNHTVSFIHGLISSTPFVIKPIVVLPLIHRIHRPWLPVWEIHLPRTAISPLLLSLCLSSLSWPQ